MATLPAHRHLMRTVIAGTGAIALTAGLLDMQAEAHTEFNVTCNANDRGNLHIGGFRGPNSLYYGAAGRFETKNPELCGTETTTATFSSVWVMATAPSDQYPGDPARKAWAQAGYIQAGTNLCTDGGTSCSPSSSIRAFSQHTRQCKSVGTFCTNGITTKTVWGDPITVETFYDYYVYEMYPDDGSLTMYGANQYLDTTPYATANVWDPDWTIQWFGETYHPQTDVPGVHMPEPGDYTDMDSLAYYGSGGNKNFITTAPSWGSNSAYEIKNFTPPEGRGNYGIKIWTDPNHVPP